MASSLAQNCSGNGLLKFLKYSMTDAGVLGDGIQSAKALPPNNPAINNPTSQRLVMLSSNLPRHGWSLLRSGESSLQIIYVRVNQRQVAWG